MSLADHLRELRYRLIVSVIAIVGFAVVAAVFYDLLYQIMMRPYQQALAMLARPTNGNPGSQLALPVVNNIPSMALPRYIATPSPPEAPDLPTTFD